MLKRINIQDRINEIIRLSLSATKFLLVDGGGAALTQEVSKCRRFCYVTTVIWTNHVMAELVKSKPLSASADAIYLPFGRMILARLVFPKILTQDACIHTHKHNSQHNNRITRNTKNELKSCTER